MIAIHLKGIPSAKNLHAMWFTVLLMMFTVMAASGEGEYHISLNNGPGVYYLYSLPAPGVKLRQAFI